jgi:regulatory protein
MMADLDKNKDRKRPRKITESYLHNAGLYYLQRYSTSAAHFRRVMTRKIDRSCAFHDDQSRAECLRLLQELVDKFSRAGLLNDRTYAEAQVSSLRRRGYGARAILSRLSAKGLARDIIQNAIAQEQKNSGQDDFQAALVFARRRRLGPYRAKPARDVVEARKIKNRELAAFGRAGFSSEIAFRILKADSLEISD